MASQWDVPAVRVGDLPDPLPDEVTVLDVREDLEWRHGRIPGALHIPLGQLPSRSGELPEGRVVVVCRVGARSANAVAYLTASGHDAVNLDGGMVEWADAGRPMATDSDGAPRVV